MLTNTLINSECPREHFRGFSVYFVHFLTNVCLFWVEYRILPNKCACLNKRAPSTFWWNISLKIGENLSEMSKISWKNLTILLWTPWFHQGVWQRTWSVYLVKYGSWSLRSGHLLCRMFIAAKFDSAVTCFFDLRWGVIYHFHWSVIRAPRYFGCP